MDLELFKLKKEPLRYWDYVWLFGLNAPIFIGLILYEIYPMMKYGINEIVAVAGGGYLAALAVTDFNMRIKNLYVSTILFICTLSLFILQAEYNTDPIFNNSSNDNSIHVLKCPFYFFVYLHIARIMYVFFTKSEPIYVAKYRENGKWNDELQREVNKSDRIWSGTNIVAFLIIFLKEML